MPRQARSDPPRYSIRGLDKAARKGASAYASFAATSLAQELADERAWLAAQARRAGERSTSEVPVRCACGEWNAATRKRCRHCGAAVSA